MSKRTYRVRLLAPVGTMAHYLLADSYSQAEDLAEQWANAHTDHARHGPWKATTSEVA